MTISRKTIAAAVGAALLAGVPTAMAFADFSPSGGSGGTGGTVGESQGASQGAFQGESAGQVESGASISGTNLIFNRSSKANVSQHTNAKVKGKNSNKAGNANGGKGGNAFNRF